MKPEVISGVLLTGGFSRRAGRSHSEALIRQNCLKNMLP